MKMKITMKMKIKMGIIMKIFWFGDDLCWVWVFVLKMWGA